jgi:hypothetical protein
MAMAVSQPSATRLIQGGDTLDIAGESADDRGRRANRLWCIFQSPFGVAQRSAGREPGAAHAALDGDGHTGSRASRGARLALEVACHHGGGLRAHRLPVHAEGDGVAVRADRRGLVPEDVTSYGDQL